MLSQRQQRAIMALLEQPNKQDAARAAGISPRALRSYLSDPAFVAEYERLQAEQITDAAQRGRRNMSAAMDAFKRIMDDESQNGQTRVQAARSLLEFSLRLDERENVLKRIAALEEAAAQERR